jgi:mannosyltransferase OCH1-like enzyme
MKLIKSFKFLVAAFVVLGSTLFFYLNYNKSRSINFNDFLGDHVVETNDLGVEDFEQLKFYKDNFVNNCSYLFRKTGGYERIPKVFHFIWLGPKSFPPESIQHLHSWKKFHPDWTFKFWTDSKARPCPIKGMEKHLIQDLHFTKLGGLVDKTQNYAEKSDIIRYEILFQEGGVYVDHDVECYQSFTDLNANFDFYAGLEPVNESPTRDTKFAVGNCLIGTKAGHPVIEESIVNVEKNWDKFEKKFPGKDSFSNFIRVIHRTFDSFNLAILEKLSQQGNRDIILPPAFFYPRLLNSKERLDKARFLFAEHEWKHTWFDEQQVIFPKGDILEIALHTSKLVQKFNIPIFLNLIILAANLIFLVLLKKTSPQKN